MMTTNTHNQANTDIELP